MSGVWSDTMSQENTARRKSPAFLFIGILLASLFACILVLYWWLLTPVGSSKSPINFSVTTGQGSRSVGVHLRDAKLIRSSMAFDAYILIHGLRSSLKAGMYALYPGMGTKNIVKALAAGDVLPREKLITIPEGWNADQMGDYFSKQGLFSKEAWLDAVATDPAILFPGKTFQILKDKPSFASLEGYLFPDTYRVFKDAQPKDVILKMLLNFQNKIPTDVLSTLRIQNKSFHNVLTLASIVELEVPKVADRKLVADVFLKRLDAGIALQSDVTVGFALHKQSLQVTNVDLQVDSPYNTYKHAGLPPGPISDPGLSSILAVYIPTPNPYYYFLSTRDGNVVYATTLAEHNANKAKYLR